MVDSLRGEAVLHRPQGQWGAISRVAAVSSAQRAQPLDPARVTDPRWLEIARPDPSTIPIADIGLFRRHVYGPDAPYPQGVSASADIVSLPPSERPLTPADRIVGTLHHMRGLRGL
jgi:hypothetical protein